jgi:hypothetical protein
MQNCQLLEPLAGVGWVKRFCTLEYIGENVFYFPSCHTTILCELMLDVPSDYSSKHPC